MSIQSPTALGDDGSAPGMAGVPGRWVPGANATCAPTVNAISPLLEQLAADGKRFAT